LFCYANVLREKQSVCHVWRVGGQDDEIVIKSGDSDALDILLVQLQISDCRLQIEPGVLACDRAGVEGQTGRLELR
jgi:hypothetical protein